MARIPGEPDSGDTTSEEEDVENEGTSPDQEEERTDRDGGRRGERGGGGRAAPAPEAPPDTVPDGSPDTSTREPAQAPAEADDADEGGTGTIRQEDTDRGGVAKAPEASGDLDDSQPTESPTDETADSGSNTPPDSALQDAADETRKTVADDTDATDETTDQTTAGEEMASDERERLPADTQTAIRGLGIEGTRESGLRGPDAPDKPTMAASQQEQDTLNVFEGLGVEGTPRTGFTPPRAAGGRTQREREREQDVERGLEGLGVEGTREAGLRPPSTGENIERVEERIEAAVAAETGRDVDLDPRDFRVTQEGDVELTQQGLDKIATQPLDEAVSGIEETVSGLGPEVSVFGERESTRGRQPGARERTGTQKLGEIVTEEGALFNLGPIAEDVGVERDFGSAFQFDVPVFGERESTRGRQPGARERVASKPLDEVIADVDEAIRGAGELETLPAGERESTRGRQPGARERVAFEEAPEEQQVLATGLEGAVQSPALAASGAGAIIDAGEFVVEGGTRAARGDSEGVESLLGDAKQVAANQASLFAAQGIEEPARTGARTAGTLVGSAALFGGAAAVGSRTSAVTRGLIQPGEEALGIGGFRATRAIGSRVPGVRGEVAAQRLFPNQEPLIFSEEAAIRAARRTAELGSRSARRAGRRAQVEATGVRFKAAEFRARGREARLFSGESDRGQATPLQIGRQRGGLETDVEVESESEMAGAESRRMLEEAQRPDVEIKTETETESARTRVRIEPGFDQEVGVESLGLLEEAQEAVTVPQLETRRRQLAESGTESELDIETEVEPGVRGDVDVETRVGIESRTGLRLEQELEQELEIELELETELEQELETEVMRDEPTRRRKRTRGVGGDVISDVFENPVIAPRKIQARERDLLEGLDE